MNITKAIKQSEKYLSVFEKTMDGIKRVNLSIINEINSRKEEIKDAEQDITALDELKNRNNKAVKNLEKILGEN